MENQSLHYDAFISYRHTQPDKFVAEKLHRELESFRLPANVEKKLKKDNTEAKTRIKRVFRDEEELPLASNLEDPIIEALKNSDYLIVICSPRLKESLWCRKEIETFVELHGVDRVLTVLVEGEPEDSFPTELLNRERDAIDREGNHITIREKIEPLAADVRADNDKDRLKALKSEKLRLIAAMFNLNYDDLKQRHREQHQRRVMGVAAAITGLALLIGGLSTYTAITLSHKNDEIRAQAEEIETQAYEIKLQSMSLEEQYDKLTTYQAESLANEAFDCIENDERYEAIENAYYSLTEYDGIEMPYTDLGRYALSESLVLYDISKISRSCLTIGLTSTPVSITASPDGSVVMIYDNSGALTFWDTSNCKLMSNFQSDEEILSMSNFSFIDDDTAACIADGKLISIDVSTGEATTIYETDDFFGLSFFISDIENGRLYTGVENSLITIDAGTGSVINETDIPGDVISSNFNISDNGQIAFCTSENYINTHVVVMDADGTVLYDEDFEDTSVESVYLYDGILYVLEIIAVDPDDMFSGFDTVTVAYDPQSGEELFRNSEKSIYGKKLYHITDVRSSNNEPVEAIVVVGSYGIAEYEAYTGETLVVDYESDGILWSDPEDSFVGYISSDYTYYNLIMTTTIGNPSYFDCHMSDVDMITEVKDGYLFHPLNEKNIMLFRPILNPDIKKSDLKVEPPESESYYYNYAIEIAKELGIEDYNFVNSVVYDTDGKKVCVTYTDKHVCIYTTDKLEVVAAFDAGGKYESIGWYLGTDNEGNEYWASDDAGYCISPDGNLIAVIDKMIAISEDKKTLYLGYNYDGADVYEVPVYSVDDMLGMAAELID